MTKPLFLTLDEVLGIHADQIRRYGGRRGLRDLRLLQSALGMPETTVPLLPGVSPWGYGLRPPIAAICSTRMG